MATMHREIPLYVPDIPTAEELLPWLKQIDERHWYTNFGPLAWLFEEQLRDHFPPAPAAQVAAMANGTLGLALAARPAARREHSDPRVHVSGDRDDSGARLDRPRVGGLEVHDATRSMHHPCHSSR